MDIGTPERYLQASWDILEGRVRTAAGARLDGAGLLVEDGAQVDPERQRQPAGAARGRGRGRGRRGGRGPRRDRPPLRDRRAGDACPSSVVLSDCRIGPRASVHEAILAPGVEVGEGARIEAGAVIGEGARIEAGVERRRRGAPGPGRGRVVSDALAEVRATDRSNQLDRRSRPSRAALGRAVAGRVGEARAVRRGRRARRSAAWAGRRSAATWPPSRSASRLSRPLDTVRSYELPSCTLPDRAVLCSSYSGDTEETIACYEAAEALGARRIVATTGGELAAAARRDGVPVIGLPAGLQPRAAVGYLFTVAAEVAALVGAAPGIRTEIDSSAAHLREASDALAELAAGARRAARGLDSRDLRRGPDGARSPSAGRPRSTRTPSCPPSRPSCPRPTTTRSPAGRARASRVASAPSSSRTATSTRASGSASS